MYHFLLTEPLSLFQSLSIHLSIYLCMYASIYHLSGHRFQMGTDELQISSSSSTWPSWVLVIVHSISFSLSCPIIKSHRQSPTHVSRAETFYGSSSSSSSCLQKPKHTEQGMGGKIQVTLHELEIYLLSSSLINQSIADVWN